jgi:mycofactocin precursor
MDTDVMHAAPAAPESDVELTDDELIAEDDLTTGDLIEEVSIDGMCGVY